MVLACAGVSHAQGWSDGVLSVTGAAGAEDEPADRVDDPEGAAGQGDAAESADDPLGIEEDEEDEDDDELSEVEPIIELDLKVFLESPDVMADVAGDGVWQVRAQPGRRLVQIPLRLRAGDGVSKYNPSTLRVVKGRFLAWRLGERPEKAPAGSRREQIVAENEAQQPPSMTRRFSLDEGWTVRWKLARFIPNGTVVKSGAGYALLLDSDQLKAKHPGQRPRVTRRHNETTDAFRQRRRAATIAYREKSQAYGELSKSVRGLPKNFEQSAPSRVWAIVEVNTDQPVLGLVGPGDMTWSIDIADLVAVRRLIASKDKGVAKASGRVGLTGDAIAAIDAMDRLAVHGGHPYNVRAAAYGVGMSDVVNAADPGDRLFKMLNRLVLHEDDVARRVTVKRLVTTFPPTAATRQLLAVASTEAIDTEVQLSRLTTLLTLGGNDPDSHQELVVSANRMLTDGDGPAAEHILGKLIEAAEGHPDAIGTLQEGVRFADLEGDRRREAVAYVVARAGSSELAGRWLDRGLLGSVDAALVRLTLGTLDAAGRAGESGRTNFIDRGVELLFGPGKKRGNEPNWVVPKVELSGTIGIGRADHGLIRVLEKQDREMIELGWRVLRHFRLGGGDEAPDEDEARSVRGACEALVSAATVVLPHESAVVEFLADQPEWTGATDALVRLVLEGDSELSLRAVRELRGSGRALGDALQKLSPDGRHVFAARVYEGDRRGVPLAAGLLRAGGRDGVIVDWFGKRVSEGDVPGRAEWARAFGGEERLLGTLISRDGELAAGAVGALVAMIGGEEADAEEMVQELEQIGERTLVNLEAHWIHTKAEIFTAKIVETAGWYELTLEVREVGDAEGFGLRWEVDLGRVYVQTDGRTLRFGNRAVALSAPAGRISIRVDNPEELKFVVHDKLERLPLDRIEGHLDLLPEDNGGWTGGARLVDGRTIRLVMLPVGHEQ